MFVLTRQTTPPAEKSECLGNVQVYRVPPHGLFKGKGWRAIWPNLLFLSRILFLLVKKASKYDLLLVSGSKFFPIITVPICRIYKKRLVIKIEAPSEINEEISTNSLGKMGLRKSSLLFKIFSKTRAALMRQADGIIALSPEIREGLIHMGISSNKIWSIPNGIYLHRFLQATEQEKLELRQQLFLPLNKDIFVYTGRLVITKGLPLLLSVWEQLVQEHKNIHLLLVGCGKGNMDDCEDELVDFMKGRGLEQRVTITGFVDNVNDYLKASDIFILPSEYESFSLSLVEAMACGLPIISTRVGIAPDLITDYVNGLLVNPKDQHGIYCAFKWILENKAQWPAIGVNARKKVEKHFSIDVVSDQYIEMFIRLSKNQNLSRLRGRSF